MKIKDYKCKCGHNDFFFTDKGNQKGIYCSYCGKWVKWADKDEQNLTMKQDPCDDAISRADVKKYLSAPDANGDRVIYESDLDLLPPVTPTRPTARWERLANNSKKCSNCGKLIIYYYDYKYCPNCGARMAESEDNKDGKV